MSKCSENIKKYRKEKNLTQTELANMLFVSKQAVSKWETGKGYPDTASLPLIVNTLGVSIDELMGEKSLEPKKSKIKILLFSFIGILVTVLLFFLLVPSLIDINKNIVAIKGIAQQIGYDLPTHGLYVTITFEDWTIYGNTIPVNTMSYIVFSDDKELTNFEDEIKNSHLWAPVFPEELLPVVINEIQQYTTIGDYYMLYNSTSKTYNALPSSLESNDYLLLIYQKDLNRLIIFEYTFIYEEVTNEK
jgi:transcriptional regulator with XRE-family HTH domain